ncbi:hypothetical protein MKX03_033394 [Papaver bracteatum]|nr:hypothetical protein MKX03_033394 [Papaver bracteatum]
MLMATNMVVADYLSSLTAPRKVCVMHIFCHCEVSDQLVDNSAQEALLAIAGYNLVSISTLLRKMCYFSKIHSSVGFASNNQPSSYRWTVKRVTGYHNWQQCLTIPTSLAYYQTSASLNQRYIKRTPGSSSVSYHISYVLLL